MKLGRVPFGLVLALALLWTAWATGDSLNCRLVGNWPFGPSLAVALNSPVTSPFAVQAAGSSFWTLPIRPTRSDCQKSAQVVRSRVSAI